MNEQKTQYPQLEKWAGIAVWAIIVLGVALRLTVFIQNRNLIIDEANIARNLSERGFLGLLRPLSYEQFAPPVFLWVEELFSQTFGYGEKALRLYPLLCGVASLFVFRDIMRRFVPDRSFWLPMAMMAFTSLMVKYSVEVKQYMPDALIALLLVHFALQKRIFGTPPLKFLVFWIVAGTLAICASMPSVFTLAAVGIYYSMICVRKKRWRHFNWLVLIGSVWLAVFMIYYWAILKPQIGSDYLQNYHADYFLYAIPNNVAEWKHNWKRIEEIISNVGGYTFLNFSLTLLFLVTGFVAAFRSCRKLLVLAGLPVVFTLIAAMAHQFSLIDRVALFIVPLLMMFFALGYEQFWKIKLPAVRVALVITGIVMIASFNKLTWFVQKFGFHEITLGLDYLNEKKVKGQEVFINDASVPTYIYYTELHPDRDKYVLLLGARRLKWDSDYTKETTNVSGPVWFVYTGGFPQEERQRRTAQIEQNLKQVDYFEKYVTFVYGYERK
jgi:4-amino-4-deoxy-L-arabinose transferase-like glycosyltransferase